jgi:hypothetical protein
MIKNPFRRRGALHASLQISLWGSLLLSGCAGPGAASSPGAREKLSRLGLELVSEKEAAIPAQEAGRYVPCRVIPGFPRPALDPHPAGYLIVGVDRRPAPNAEAILQAVAGWGPGETLVLTVRRNPYVEGGSGWWEADVVMKLQPAPEAK